MFQSLLQANKTLHEITKVFYELQAKNGLDEVKYTIGCYLNSLRQSIQNEIELFEMSIVDEAYGRALKAEEQQKRFATQKSNWKQTE